MCEREGKSRDGRTFELLFGRAAFQQREVADDIFQVDACGVNIDLLGLQECSLLLCGDMVGMMMMMVAVARRFVARDFIQ